MVEHTNTTWTTPYQLKKRKYSAGSGQSCYCGSTSHFVMPQRSHLGSAIIHDDNNDTNNLLMKKTESPSDNNSMSSPTPPSPPPRVKGSTTGDQTTSNNNHSHHQNNISETLNTLFNEMPCYSSHAVGDCKYFPSSLGNKRSKCQKLYRLFNSQINTQIGQLSTAYQKFQVTFWIDRLLLVTGVYFPISVGILMIIIHAFLGVSKCLPNREANQENFHYQSSYVDKACGLQLSFNILQGQTDTSIMPEKKAPFMATGANLQQECYPFILIIIAALMWLPHKLTSHLIEPSARRDLCFIKGELHSFRESLARELAGNSCDQVPCNTNNNTNPQTIQSKRLLSHQNHGYQVSSSHSANSSQQPDGPGNSIGNNLDAKSNCFSVIDTEFSSPGLVHLPDYVSCRNDWSLNAYLSGWQNADFYWIRYLTKHCVLAFFYAVNFISILTVVILNRGAPFVALFKCELQMSPAQSPVHLVCMLQTTFLANMSVLIFGLLALISLLCQIVFFYNNFFQTHFLKIENTNRIGYRIDELSPINSSDRIKNDRARYFFGDYICLLAFATFKETNKEIRNMTVTISPKIFRTDFHMLSLMCNENVHLLPDAMHIHFWMERYARLVKKRCTKPGWFSRQTNMGHLVRCEDISMKFNFSKIGVKLEVIDFF